MGDTLHVNRPRAYSYRTFSRCPRCKRRRRHVARMYVCWYEPLLLCCACSQLARSEWPSLKAYDDRAERRFITRAGATP